MAATISQGSIFFMGVDFAFMLVLPFEPRRYGYKLMPNFTMVGS
jgi:hypothetical protein